MRWRLIQIRVSVDQRASYFLRSLSFLPLAVRLWACRSWAVARLLLNKLWSSSKSFFFSSKAAFSSAWRRFSCSKRLCSWKEAKTEKLQRRLRSVCLQENQPLNGYTHPPTSLSASFSSASFSFTLWTNICLISSSLLCSSSRNSWRLASYVCCKLQPPSSSSKHQRSSAGRRAGKAHADIGSPDWFALWSRVFESHFLQFTTSVQLIVASVSLLSQVLHVYTDQHLPQFHKVTVVFIFHWHTK